MSDIIHAIGEVTIEAAAGDGKPAKISILAYAGGEMSPPGFGPTVLELSGIEHGADVVLLADHANEVNAVVGRGVPSKADGKLFVNGIVSTATPAGQTVLALARDGVSLGASVGIEVTQREHAKAGSVVRANGKAFTAGPRGLTVVRGGRLVEISITPVPADRNTAVSISANSRGKTTMTTNPNFNEDTIRASERQRLAEIEKLCTAPIGGWGAKARRVDELRASALDAEISLDELRAGLLDVLRTGRATAPNIGIGGDRPAESNVLTASLCLSWGCGEKFLGAQFGERVVDAAVSQQNRHASYHTLMRAVLRAAGQPLPEGRFTASDVRRAFDADLQLRASGFSTISLPGILSNAANKKLLDSYLSVPVAWRQFCSIGSNVDFKVSNRYRLTGVGQFEEVGKGGEIKHGTLAEDTYESQLKTYGKMLTITRQDLINDDLSAFKKMSQVLGRMSSLAIERALFTLLLSNPTGSDGFAFFSTDHANYDSGADSVLSIDALTAAESLFLRAVDANAEPIGIQPRFLVVTPELSVTGILLTSSLEIRDTYSQSTASDQYPVSNPHAKRFNTLTVPWLSNSGLTGYSATGWYLFADPAQGVAVAEVSFLNAQQNPTIETADVDFNQLGVSMRAFHDFGVSLEDYRAGVHFAGA